MGALGTIMKRTSTSPVCAAKRTKITDFFHKKVVVRSVSNDTPVSPVNTGKKTNFKEQFAQKLNDEQKELLQLEINTLEDSWFEALHKELTKPYFLNLKRFLKQQRSANKIFPPMEDVYSWSRLTPLSKVKVIILGQDPYHNDNQAHGLAFSVKPPTVPPPSLKNIYKALKMDYPQFEVPLKSGDLTLWAEQGVLLLNACLTVRAHEANSHSGKGWEQFTEEVLKVALNTGESKVLMLWGTPAQNRVKTMNLKNHYALRSVHPSPLSARRGFFDGHHFKKCNDWLIEQGRSPVRWELMKGNVINYKNQS